MIDALRKEKLSVEHKVEMMKKLASEVQSKLRSNKKVINHLAMENSVLKENLAYLNIIMSDLKKGL